MEKRLKKPIFRTSSLIVILVIELLIIDMIFMFCIVEVYASQLQQTSARPSVEIALEESDTEGSVVAFPGEVEGAEINVDESNAEISEEEPEVTHNEPELTEATETKSSKVHDEYRRHEVSSEFILYDLPLSDELQRYTFDKSLERGLNYEMLLAIMFRESTFRDGVVSRTNDYGLMQVNRGNHRWLSESLGITDFLDPKQNIDAGTFHLKGIVDNGFDDIHQILMVYNLGGNKARELWLAGIRTSAYSRSVVEYMESLRWMRRSQNAPPDTELEPEEAISDNDALDELLETQDEDFDNGAPLDAEGDNI